MVEENNRLKLIFRKTFPVIITGFLMTSSFIFGVFFGSGQIKQIGPIKLPGVIINKETGKPNNVDFKIFWDAWTKLENNYVGEVDYEKMLYGAMKGMAESLGDPYTVFLDPDEAKEFTETIEGSFSGIGIEIGVRNNALVVISPLPGTPADKAGLRSRDQILKIDGENALDMTFDEAIKNIRGPQGTEVVLYVRRGDEEPQEYRIKRDIIKIDNVKLEYKETENGKIAILKIVQFGQDSSSEFNKAVEDVLINQPTGIILDLRGNSGGFLNESLVIASEFFDGGTIMIEESKEDKRNLPEDSSKGRLTNQDLIVLIDEGSASASEIVAGAIKDRNRGKVLGMKSFGKGLVQEVFELERGFLKITVSKWLTPQGKSINNEGIEPDIKIELTEDDYNNYRDPQLEEALKII